MIEGGQSAERPRVAISASIAFDYIMSFPGSFADHILPDKIHVLSVSFLVESLRRQRGGIGGNIAYNLALLGTRPALVGAVGSDFGPYRAVFDELGIDMTAVIDVPEELTASAFMMTDRRDNQIASFFPGASNHATAVSVAELGATVEYSLVGAAAPDTMRRHATEFSEAGGRLIYDPSQQVIVLSPEDIVAGIDQGWAVVGNDYEFAMIEQKTGLSVEMLTDRLDLLVITYGDQGSELRQDGRRVRVPAVLSDDVRDPTGAGDAFRAGLIKGLLLGLDLEVTGRIASLTATHAVEHLGTQEHTFTPETYVGRFNKAFPEFTGAIVPADLDRAAEAPSLTTAVR